MGDILRRGTRDKPRFYIRYQDLDAGRKTRRVRVSTRDEARQLLALAEARAAQGRVGMEPIVALPKCGPLMDEWLETLANRNAADDRSRYKRHIKAAFADMLVRDAQEIGPVMSWMELRFERPRPITKLEGFHRITYVANEIRKRKWFIEAPSIISIVNATRPVSLEASSQRVAEIPVDLRQRLLALAIEGIRFLEFWLSSPRARATAEPRLRRLISARRRESRGVAQHTWKLVEDLRGDIAMAIAKRLIARPMNAWDLCAFLIGLEGQAIALRRLARMSSCRASFVSVNEALMRINQQNVETMRAAEDLRRRCHSFAEVVPREESREAEP